MQLSWTLAILLVASGVALVLLSLTLRAKSDGRYEIKAIEVVLVVLPLFVWLFANGDIKGFKFGALEVTASEAILTAAKGSADAQVEHLVPASIEGLVENVQQGDKDAHGDIPQLLRKHTEALVFQLHKGDYSGATIRAYFESLSADGALRFVIVNRRDGTLMGIFHAGPLVRSLQTRSSAIQSGTVTNAAGGATTPRSQTPTEEDSYDRFADALTKGNEEELRTLPGVIPPDDFVSLGATKRAVLDAMRESTWGVLPVVDNQKRFVGIVERSRVTASLVVDIVDLLTGRQPVPDRGGK